jgi:hypothetical protein
MAGFDKKVRQRIIDDYLSASGANMFVASDFVDWLSERPDHEAYDWFFAAGDEADAREWRIHKARQMAGDLRIVAPVSTAPESASVVGITVREFPAFVSPMSGRKAGGGYLAFDPHDAASVAELRRQGAVALRGWLARYRGVMELSGVEVAQIEQIAAQIEGRVALSA